MSYIPDCRDDDVYNFENLNAQDQDFVKGYDFCADYAVDSFMSNLQDEFPADSFLGHALSTELPEYLQDSYEWEVGGQTEERHILTYGDLLYSKLIDHIESMRDELIVGMIDGYEGEE